VGPLINGFSKVEPQLVPPVSLEFTEAANASPTALSDPVTICRSSQFVSFRHWSLLNREVVYGPPNSVRPIPAPCSVTETGTQIFLSGPLYPKTNVLVILVSEEPSFVFGNQIVGTTSGVQYVTLTNIGTATFDITGNSISGDFAFGDLGTCTSTITVGESCTYSATFTPTTTGLRTGVITIYGNVPSGSVTIPLNGTGVSPSPTPSPSPSPTPLPYEYIAQVTGPSSDTTTLCSQTSYSVVRTNPKTGKPVTGSVSAPRTFNLSSSSSTVIFYSDSKCSKAISSVTISVGTYFTNFYIKDSKSENMSVTATPVNLPFWGPGSMNINEVSAKTYTTKFPLTENPISEGGKWVNGGTAGLDWTNILTIGGVEAYGTNPGTGNGYNDSTAVLQGDGPWGPNQLASGVVYLTAVNNSYYAEVELRLNTTVVAHNITGYECNASINNDGTQYFSIVRWNGPINNFTQLSTVHGAPPILNGDMLSCQNIGGVISLYHNGTLLESVTDTTYTGGSPGIGTDLGGNGGANTNIDFGFSQFSASSWF